MSARENRSRKDGRRRRPVPLVVALAAIPVGLTLAGALLVTGAGESLNPFRDTADETLATGRIGDAVADDSAVPEASADDDFFASPSAPPQDRPSPSGAGGPQSADVTASSVPEEAQEDGSPSGGGGGGGGSGDGDDGERRGRGGSGPSSAGGSVDQVVTLVNGERASAGCDPLKVDPRLTAAAQEHSEDMDRRDYMSHENPEGEGPADRALRHGYDAWGAENVAKGQTSAAQVMDAWMGSRGHRDNILNCDLVAIGVGESGNAWTQKFGWE
ncbi:CAP domain-containing protein [Nocardiopsis sp. CA-288880]|uniref:CAP domain-containing protein n=1 Tax=Nocardiopsis sp. CA-288880 TaxID=3239995 RepID=UPI003D984A60